MTRTNLGKTGLRALWLVCLGWGAFAAAWAGPGHDHGPGAAPAPVATDAPRRLPDGSAWVPKPAQHAWALRTQVAVVQTHPQTLELAGTVTMDPNAGGKVQAALAGRLEAGPRGLPALGQSVRKGEVLGYVVPVAGALEQAGQRAQQAEWRAAQGLAQQRVRRLRELADTVPRKELEAAESELQSLTQRLAAVGEGLNRRDALLAPVTGVIASANAVAGQVLDARELVFEVVDPQRLRIEALAYDPAQAQGITGAAMAVQGRSVPLRFVGAARSLREQALPLAFAGDAAALGALAVGQQVRVVAQTRAQVQGVVLPLASLQRNASNQPIVWVKVAPEQFAPRVVTAQPLDGAQVVVTAGLQPGERVATQAATLLNQVR